MGRGDRDRLERVVGRRRGRLPRTCGALRGALRPHNHHSFGRVDSVHRRRSLGTGARGGGRPRRRARGRARRCPVVGLLRPPHAGSRAETLRGEGRGAAEACAGPPTPICTCRWWQGSSSSPWASSKPWPTSGIHSEPSRLWRFAAGSPSTFWGTTPSGCARSAA
jgi:hypothetical protein